MKLIPEIVQWQDEFSRIRRDIHRHPELAYEEFRTADIVAKKLDEWGIEYHRGLAGTGIVAKLTKGHGHRAIGLRADLDALAMSEANSFGHASVHAGKFHGCGHDGHTAMLLAAAKYLQHHASFDGTVYLIFQPAEEAKGGAIRMVKEGLFEQFPMQAVYGLHNIPTIPVGTVLVLPGPFFASFDQFELTVTGVGGHGAMPSLAIDPVPILAEIITAWQTVVARQINPFQPAVVSTTMLKAGDAPNVIPQTASASGGVRTLSADTRERIEEKMRSTAVGIASGYGASADLSYEHGYPVLVNSQEHTEHCEQVARGIFGVDRVRRPDEPMMGSEDFAAMLQEKPGCYILMGNGDGEGTCMVHNPGYDFNDEILPMGSTYWVRLVEDQLAVDRP